MEIRRLDPAALLEGDKELHSVARHDPSIDLHGIGVRPDRVGPE